MDEKQKRKILIMQIGAGVLTGLILLLWIFNLKNVWQANKLAAASNGSQWSTLKNNLDKSLTEVKQQLNQINEDKKTQAAANNLLTDLMKETGKISSSSVSVSTSSPAASASLPIISTSSPSLATSSPASREKSNGCPAYINCMPTIGEARPCQIPAGCEGITVIAY